MISNIRNETISEEDTKKKIDKLKETKKLETKGKRLIKSREKLLSLFDDQFQIIIIMIIIIILIMRVIVKVWTKIRVKIKVKMKVKMRVKIKMKVMITIPWKKTNKQYFLKDRWNKIIWRSNRCIKKIPWLNDYWYIDYYKDNKEREILDYLN